MRALVFDVAVWKYLAAKAVGKRYRRVFYGPGSCFDLRDVPPPELPGDDWLLLRPRMTGLCGSDLAAIFFKFSPATSVIGFGAGERAVLGHEILADVLEVGRGARGTVKEGDRVVVDPVLGCVARGEPPCTRCEAGDYATCHRVGTSKPRGISLGFCTKYPGGMCERIVAHKSMVFRVPEAVPDDVAALTEPLSIAVHAVLRHPPAEGERVLVIGGGVIAFSVLWALREIAPSAHVTLYTVEDYQLPLARSFGAHDTWSPKGGPFLEQAAHATGSSLLEPIIGRPFLNGGFRRVYDCVGSRASLDDALRATDGGGTVVLVGAAGILPALDWTFVWQKELKIEGTAYYGVEAWAGRRARTFEATLELMTTTGAPLASLVTHKFPLEEYAKAIEVNLDRARHHSVKALFVV
jgi:L-iditol 2-dehydrogenase